MRLVLDNIDTHQRGMNCACDTLMRSKPPAPPVMSCTQCTTPTREQSTSRYHKACKPYLRLSKMNLSNKLAIHVEEEEKIKTEYDRYLMSPTCGTLQTLFIGSVRSFRTRSTLRRPWSGVHTARTWRTKCASRYCE